MRIPLFLADAFANGPFQGNPAAICFLSRWLDDGVMRKVASENNLSATAFLVERDHHYELRWFSPRCEIQLCGHATLAAGFLLLNVLHPTLKALQIQTRYHGTVAIRKEAHRIAMDFPAFVSKLVADAPPGLLSSLGMSSPPYEILQANSTYIVVCSHENQIQDLRPDVARLERLHPFAVAVTAPGMHADFVSRYFAPSYGIPEDPVTGSLHCSLAPYWAKRLGKTHLHAQQLSARGGELWCEWIENRVVLRGEVVLTLEGSLVI